MLTDSHIIMIWLKLFSDEKMYPPTPPQQEKTTKNSNCIEVCPMMTGCEECIEMCPMMTGCKEAYREEGAEAHHPGPGESPGPVCTEQERLGAAGGCRHTLPVYQVRTVTLPLYQVCTVKTDRQNLHNGLAYA